MRNQETQTPFIHPIHRRDNFVCQYCGKDGLASFDNWANCSVDHFVPRKHGGTDDDGNLLTCCRYCNAIKGQRVFETLPEARDYVLGRLKELREEYETALIAVRG